MKYQNFPYKRINLDQFRIKIQQMISDFNSADSADQQIRIIQDYQNLQKKVQTFASIANLNFARGTKNKNAKEETEFYDMIMPEISAIDNQFTKV